MDNSLIIRLTFLILPLIFVGSLLSGLVKLLNVDWGEEGATAKNIVNHFKVSIISFVLFFVFVMFILPLLS